MFFDGGKPSEKSKSFSAPSSSGGNKNFSAHSSASGDKKGEFISFLRENYKSADTLSSLNSPIPANLLPCSIFVSSQEQNTGLVERGHRVNVLLDTGSLAGDFVSDRLVNDLGLSPFVLVSTPKSVCSGFNNQCVDLHRTLQLSVFFRNELTKNLI